MGYTRALKYGDVFGRLTVLSKDIEKSGHDIFWKCQCSCGNITSVRASHLVNGKIKSCGCYRREKNYRKAQDPRALWRKHS